ncbi:cytochrome P450 [Aspergillus candidus]|uniref:Cytochrome P450 n=1 Tax=Aspergillus candidus TaxID=41067 RepID=A0A2I2FGJ9_ASPCN|nr:cytochrome P450 [Aspergillus candidus]PLB39757.1 cytochrome P450 [Aspergillus candidus]
MILESIHSPVAVIATAVVALLYLVSVLQRKWAQRRMARENNCLPPVRIMGKDPLFGLDEIYSMIQAGKDHVMLDRAIKRFGLFGNTFASTRIRTNLIFTCEPLIVKTILSLKFKDFSLGNRISSFGPLLGHGIFTTDGAHWAQSRAMIRPNFVKDQVAHLDLFEDLMADLFDLIPTDGSTVDLQDLFFGYTIDSATEFLFGHSVHSLKKRLSRVNDDSKPDFAEAFNYAQDATAIKARLGGLRRFYRNSKADECNRVCHEMVDEFVDKAMKVRDRYDEEKAAGAGESNGRYYFLSGLARQTGDRRRIRDELMNVLLAGRDTTASLLSNMFFMLAKNPRIWNKLREEIATLDGRAPTYEQLRNLTYLKYCMNESLRLHPVVPSNSRLAVADTVLPVGGGPDGKSPVFVPKGTIVAYSVYSMHRREDIYGPDANEYRPERWADIRPGWEYLPFNGGPRICVGQQYALTEAGYVTVRLAQRFATLESRDPGPWEESLTLTLCSRNGTKVSVRP